MLKAGASGYINQGQRARTAGPGAAQGRPAGGTSRGARGEPRVSATGLERPARAAVRRESQVFILLAKRKTLKAIARDLDLSPRPQHLQARVMQKLKVASDASWSATASPTSW